ncbi:hypothetical protein RRG08_060221 [Elysia crispata]|uniref:Fibrinogen C-terminal domain-containing protein n=1 Tax=Elysia crispata TaxID=231223 RepID=A0AAE1DNM7_9GAST|nr:hypothetical protein RRG08_060221 [Elysia crispata]
MNVFSPRLKLIDLLVAVTLEDIDRRTANHLTGCVYLWGVAPTINQITGVCSSTVTSPQSAQDGLEETMVRIEMEDWSGKRYLATYDHFRVDGARENFTLHISGYSGDAGDSMNSVWENHDGMPFSTKDRDNDGRYYDSCAAQYHGAWWFNNCFEAHLNGKYYTKGFHKDYFQRDGIQWNTIHMYSSLKGVQMMVKPAKSA